MAETLARMYQLIGTTLEWSLNNLVLGEGEIGFEQQPDGTVKAKIGTGTSPFSALPYFTAAVIAVKDDGAALESVLSILNFVGAGVTATTSAGEVTVTIPGAAPPPVISVADEGSPLTTMLTGLNFVGAGVTATNVSGNVTVTIAGSSASALAAKDEGTTLTAGATSFNFVGAGVTATVAGTDVTVTIPGGGGGGGAWNLQWSPMDNEPPATNYATLDSRNGHPVLDFDTTTQEAAVFSGALPADYSGAGVAVHLWCAATSAVAGTVGWDVAFERMDVSSLDLDADSFGAATVVTAATVPATSGQFLKMSVNVSSGTNMDGLVAGEMFRLRIRRDVATDTATGDAELLRVMMVSQ